MNKLIEEIERRVAIIKSEPDGVVRESMIDLLADSLTDFVELEATFDNTMKWVKCSDRLPDTTRKVIVYFNDKSVDFGRFDESQWLYSVYDTRHITHWMELPESPNEYNTEQ